MLTTRLAWVQITVRPTKHMPALALQRLVNRAGGGAVRISSSGGGGASSRRVAWWRCADLCTFRTFPQISICFHLFKLQIFGKVLAIVRAVREPKDGFHNAVVKHGSASSMGAGDGDTSRLDLNGSVRLQTRLAVLLVRWAHCRSKKLSLFQANQALFFILGGVVIIWISNVCCCSATAAVAFFLFGACFARC